MALRSTPEAFIKAETVVKPVPHAPEICLHVADEAMALWQRTEDELEQLGLAPPFWAFAWAGGQALARYILDHPELVKGRKVLDFACGSGIVGIAAMKAGAATCTCVDIDPFATAATQLNAVENDVSLSIRCADITSDPVGDFDVAFFGDVFYELPMANSIIAMADRYLAAKIPVLVGDPGRSYLPKERLSKLATYEVPVTGSLEDADIKKTSVFLMQPAENQDIQQ